MSEPTAGGGSSSGDGSGPGEGVSCEEALARVYEYLDGELEPEMQEGIHRHLEICQRCYPFFNFERLFLDYVRERGLSARRNEELQERVRSLLQDLE